MMQTDPVQPGQSMRIPADVYNGLLAMYREWLGDAGSGGQRPRAWRRDTILVKNDTAGSISQYGILGLAGLALNFADNPTEFLSRPAFSGVAPAAGKPFAVVQRPIPAGEVGPALVSGITPVQIAVAAPLDSTQMWADLIPGDTAKLTQTPFGSARILHCENQIATTWCIVELGGLRSTVGAAIVMALLNGAGAAYTDFATDRFVSILQCHPYDLATSTDTDTNIFIACRTAGWFGLAAVADEVMHGVDAGSKIAYAASGLPIQVPGQAAGVYFAGVFEPALSSWLSGVSEVATPVEIDT